MSKQPTESGGHRFWNSLTENASVADDLWEGRRFIATIAYPVVVEANTHSPTGQPFVLTATGPCMITLSPTGKSGSKETIGGLNLTIACNTSVLDEIPGDPDHDH